MGGLLFCLGKEDCHDARTPGVVFEESGGCFRKNVLNEVFYRFFLLRTDLHED